ncbi:hypothetical protein B566_EDAN014936 [Ephemera danica]|nr:hypothetical protein B566_EDAN014936 [Ephemera danica]
MKQELLPKTAEAKNLLMIYLTPQGENSCRERSTQQVNTFPSNFLRASCHSISSGEFFIVNRPYNNTTVILLDFRSIFLLVKMNVKNLKTFTDSKNVRSYPHYLSIIQYCHIEFMEHSFLLFAVPAHKLNFKVVLAIEHGYKVIEAYEVHEYKVRQYNPLTRDLICQQILKTEANVFWVAKAVMSEEEKRKYIVDYLKHEGIQLDYDLIKHNSCILALSKLLLCSVWGKFGQKTNLTKTNYDNDENDPFKLLLDTSLEVQSVEEMSELMFLATWNYKEDIYALVHINKPDIYTPPNSDHFGDLTFQAILLYTKSGKKVTSEFQKLMRLHKREPEKLNFDKGKEFLIKIFLDLLRANNIQYYTSNNPDIKNTEKFIDILPMVIASYNNSVHSTTKFAPSNVKDKNVLEIWRNMNGNKK